MSADICKDCGVHWEDHDWAHLATECYPKQSDALRAVAGRARTALRECADMLDWVIADPEVRPARFATAGARSTLRELDEVLGAQTGELPPKTGGLQGQTGGLAAAQPEAGAKRIELTKEWCLAAAEAETGIDPTTGAPPSQAVGGEKRCARCGRSDWIGQEGARIDQCGYCGCSVLLGTSRPVTQGGAE